MVNSRVCFGTEFPGPYRTTSSATPIVAGAVLAIQGVMKACGLPALTPSDIRDTMVTTGTPQGVSVAGHIGPLPRIKAALEATAAGACISVATSR
jgi:hypothetical protein